MKRGILILMIILTLYIQSVFAQPPPVSNQDDMSISVTIFGGANFGSNDYRQNFMNYNISEKINIGGLGGYLQVELFPSIEKQTSVFLKFEIDNITQEYPGFSEDWKRYNLGIGFKFTID